MLATLRSYSLPRLSVVCAISLLAAFVSRECLAQGNAEARDRDVVAARSEAAPIACDRNALAEAGPQAQHLSASMTGLGLGGILTGTAAQPMDRLDRRCVAYALEIAGNGESVRWHNAEAGIRYEITLLESYTNYVGLICRDYTAEVRAGGGIQNIFVRACRRSDQRWLLAG
ncbi:MAG: RT0821/Lpp0805 family surface protein [Acetobacterales bacterium]